MNSNQKQCLITSIIGAERILKSEHCLNHSANSEENPGIVGVQNWQLIKACGLIICSQPDASSLGIIKELLKKQGFSKFMKWISIHEEPTVFINGKPFVVREKMKAIVKNRLYSGISAKRLEDVENRLKEELSEAICGPNSDKILLTYYEDANSTIIPAWLKAESIQTLSEIVSIDDGFSYRRIPLRNSGKTLWISFFENIDQALDDVNAKDAVIISGSTGIGPNSTFTAIACGILRKEANLDIAYIEKSDPFISIDFKLTFQRDASIIRLFTLLSHSGAFKDNILSDWLNENIEILDDLIGAMEGYYHITTEVIRALVPLDGQALKRTLDNVINECHSIRLSYEPNFCELTFVHVVRYVFLESEDDLETALTCLEQYIGLLVLTAYHSENINISLYKWFDKRVEIVSLLESIRKRNHGRLKTFRPLDSLILCQNDRGWGEAVVQKRKGKVLSSNTLLKEEIIDKRSCTGSCKIFENLPIWVCSQPNKMDTYRIIDPASFKVPLPEKPESYWINVREEPLVFVNGIPFVLRDRYKPFRNIKAYSGISAEKIEEMERQLCHDIQIEAISNLNQNILVHFEKEPMTITGKWIKVESLETSKDIFPNNLDYYRLPVTAEEPWSSEDIDALDRFFRYKIQGKLDVFIVMYDYLMSFHMYFLEMIGAASVEVLLGRFY